MMVRTTRWTLYANRVNVARASSYRNWQYQKRYLTLSMLRFLSPKAQGSCLKTLQPLSCWSSLDYSRWVLSDEYSCASISIIFRLFASFCIDQI